MKVMDILNPKSLANHVLAPLGLSGVSFIANVVQSLSDGVITHNELQGLISSASGIETVLLSVLYFIMKKRSV